MSKFKQEPWALQFHGLMFYRIRDVLLVSSDYDAFVLEEDGRLRERLFVEYSELNLVSMPNIHHVTSPGEALKALQERRFDLVLTTMRVEDRGVRGLSLRVKNRYPNIPVVLLVLDQFELRRLKEYPLPHSIDRVFLWTGDARIFLAIIKLMEDAINVKHDTRATGVQVIIVVEDSIRRYSTFLMSLYSEVMRQSQSLIAEGVNALHKVLRMRARPKILLANDYGEAWDYYTQYRDYVLALITDVQFPRNGKMDDEAGFILAREVRRDNPDLPILMQSANPENRKRALDMGLVFLNKNSPRLLRGIRDFLKESVGFGDFIFRLPDRTELARARDMYELVKILRTIDPRSLYYHASRNHFNVWLRARSMFDLADAVKAMDAGRFEDVEELRARLVDTLERWAQGEQDGVVADFTPRELGTVRQFVRVGGGSIGGKGRGIAFIHATLARHDLYGKFPGLKVQIPRTIAIGTDEFDRFLEQNDLTNIISGADDATLRRRFLEAELPSGLQVDLRRAVQDLHRPLAVRSSSLLEDSQHQSCAGIYDTILLPNRDPDPEHRFRQLCRAIKAVYASTFYSKARKYLRATPFSVEEEKMAVIIQEVVGQQYGERYYPHISGTAMSYNFYPIEPQKTEDGVVMLALGLGHIIAEGGRTVRFCPAYPEILPHLATPKQFVEYSQNQFYALDLNARWEFGEETVKLHQLSDAEEDGTLQLAASVYNPDDDILREDLRHSGVRVVTFNNILKWEAVPLAPVMAELLKLLEKGVGSPVEIEFAVDMGDWGRQTPPGVERKQPCLYLLQIRPLSDLAMELPLEEEFDPKTVLCRSYRCLGNGVVDDVADIVFVDPLELEREDLCKVARRISKLNARLLDEKRPYFLVGPGRWGSSDPSLGIPVETGDITGARLIAELPFRSRVVEPSQGSHFFHELVTLRIGYLTFPAQAYLKPHESKAFFDLDWLKKCEPCYKKGSVYHFRFTEKMLAYLCGRGGMGTVLKPGYRPLPRELEDEI